MSTEQELWTAQSLWEEVSKARPWLLELKGLLIPVLEIVVVAHNATVEARKVSGIKAPEAESGEVSGQKELESFVANLADPMKWNWCNQFHNARDAADHALELMARLKLIEHRAHPLGGDIWQINGRIYGRTDGVTAVPDDNAAHTLTGEAERKEGDARCHAPADNTRAESAPSTEHISNAAPTFKPEGAAPSQPEEEKKGKPYALDCPVCGEPMDDSQPTTHTDEGLAHESCCIPEPSPAEEKRWKEIAKQVAERINGRCSPECKACAAEIIASTQHIFSAIRESHEQKKEEKDLGLPGGV